MQHLIKVLRGMGPLGTLAANTLAFLTTNWAVAVTAVVALWASLNDWAFGIASNIHVHVFAIVFLVLLWTYIGFTVLIDRRRPRAIRPYQDYNYGLTYEGLVPIYDPNNEIGALQFGISLRNFSSGPLRYTIEQFDVRIESRSLPRYKKGALTAIMPRGAGRISSNIPFKKSDISEFTGKRVSGSVEFAIAYGHPEQPPVRKLTMTFDLVLVFNEHPQPHLAFNASITEERDEPI